MNNEQCTKKEYKNYNFEIKNKIITYIETKKPTLNLKGQQNNMLFSEASREFGVDRRLISQWWKNKESIINSKIKRKRFRINAKNDKAAFPEMEKRLLEWFNKAREQGGCISGTEIKRQILKIFESCKESNKEFCASNGWLLNFAKRHNLALRRISSTGRDLTTNGVDVVKKFFVSLENKVKNHREIFNMDETSIYLDFPSNYTYAKKGSKRVIAQTTGNEKTRLSAAFTATADGEKFPIFIIIPRKTELKDFDLPRNVITVYKSDSTFNEDVILIYIQRIIVPYCQQNDIKQPKLIWDSAKCHATQKVKQCLIDNNISVIIIPPRFTNILQPADVCWFRNLKRSYCERWNKWFLYEDTTYTVHGNARSPGYAKVTNWLSELWDSFPNHLIKNSFDFCGITSKHVNDYHMVLKCLLRNETVIQNYVDDLQPEDDAEGFEDDYRLFQTDSNAIDNEQETNETNNNLVPEPDSMYQHQMSSNQIASYDIPANQVSLYYNSFVYPFT